MAISDLIGTTCERCRGAEIEACDPDEVCDIKCPNCDYRNPRNISLS